MSSYQKDMLTVLNGIKDIDVFRNKSVLITGAGGLLGGALVDFFLLANKELKLDVSIYALGRNKEKLEERFDVQSDAKLILVEQDINESIDIDDLEEIDYIFHLAGCAHPAAFGKDPVNTIRTHVLGTENVLEFAVKSNVKKVIYYSSGEVYGSFDYEKKVISEIDYGYVDVLNPRSCYPLSKRMAENLCVSYAAMNSMDLVIARPCHIFGPRMTENDNRASSDFIRKAANKENIILLSEGLQVRSYLYVPDFVGASMTLLLKGKCGEAYNITGTDTEISIKDFAETVAELSGVSVEYKLNTDYVKTPITRQVLSGDKLRKLGWENTFDIRRGIESSVEEFK